MSKVVFSGFCLFFWGIFSGTAFALDYTPYHFQEKNYPNPVVTVYPVIGTINNPIKIDAGLSRNFLGESGSFRYRFKVEGNNNWSKYQGPIFYYTPQDYGKFTVKVEVYDTEEKTSSFTETCFWAKSQEGGKNARFQVIKKPQYVGDPAEFLVKIFSSPSEGKWARVRWDFDGDGKWDTGWSENLSGKHIYKKPRVVRPKVEVRLRENIYKTLELGTYSIRRNFSQNLQASALQRLQNGINSGITSNSNPIQGSSVEGAAKFIRDKSRCRDANCLLGQKLSDPANDSGSGGIQAKITVSKKEGTTQTNFIFDASNTKGKNPQFFWNIFDGKNNLFAEGPRVTQKFSSTGKKTITVNIVDGNQRKKVEFPVWVR